MYGHKKGSEKLVSIKQLADGGYILAGTTTINSSYTRGDWRILKLADTGRIRWQKTYGGRVNADAPYDIIATDDGGFLGVGQSRTHSAGSGDAWIIKLDVSGVIEWQYRFGESGDDRAQSAVEVPGIGYAVAGAMTREDNGDRDGWIALLDTTGGGR